jgi:hypothetical protein
MTGNQDNERPRPTRAQRLVAFAFLGAFGLTIVTVLFTGLMARSAKKRHEEPAPIAAPAEPSRDAPEAPNPAPSDAARSRHDDRSRDSRSEPDPGAAEPRGADSEPAPSESPDR